MRAVAGLPLVSPTAVKDSALMLNFLARKAGPFDNSAILADIKDPQTGPKLYGKTTSRVKRKMGHINLWGEDQWQRAKAIAEQLEL